MDNNQIIKDLKQNILNNINVNDDIVCDLCDELINKSQKIDDTQSIAFGYVWKADHYFYVNKNHKMFFDNLKQAESYIDQKKPTELLEKFYTLFRLFYDSISDNKTLLAYCLKGLKVAEELELDLRVSASYGIIGELFMYYECYEEALYYLKRSLDRIDITNDSYHRTIRLILVSLFDVYINLNELEKAKETIQLLTKMKLEEKDLKIYIDKCNLIYYSAIKNKQLTYYYAEELLNDGALDFPNPQFAFEFIRCIFYAMLHINDSEYAKKALTMLASITKEGEHDKTLKLISLKIEYDKRFDTSHLTRHYKEYYHCFNNAESILKQFKSEGLNAKILLHQNSFEQDIMKEKVLSMEKEANIDELTNVFNRRYLNLTHTSILNDKTNKNIGFVIFDVDFFKEFNDFYGHVAGDEILKHVASIINNDINENMVVCRYGGDEFVTFCWNHTLNDIENYIKRTQALLEKENIKHESSRCSNIVTLSIGYGIHNLPLKENIFSFFEKVDSALYQAKEKGRNCAMLARDESEENI